MKAELDLLTVAAFGLVAYPASARQVQESDPQPQCPNVIYILADDLGYGDLGCFGQQQFRTPHIDSLAARGMRFTQHYAGCTVSAPSRSALLTGQHTGHTPIRGNREMKDEGQFPLPAETYTLARMFQDAGYATGAYGKWGLGYPGSEGDPTRQGFDDFFGYNCQRESHRYYPKHLWHNDQKVVLAGNDFRQKAVYAPDVIHQKALEFIRANKDKPFFAYIPLIQPHAELVTPDDELFARYKGRFEETPYVGDDYGSDHFAVAGYCSQPMPRATFAAMVTRIDEYVGEMMALLTELGIDDNTLVIFTSDNGPHREGGADPDFFDSNGPFSGYKRDLTDGGVCVPMIAYWKGRIAAGSTSDLISAFWDMLPTFAELSGTKLSVETDGISILPTLLGGEQTEEHDFLYWEFKEQGGSMAVRLGDWKAIRSGVNANPDSPVQLYYLPDDPQERQDLAAKYPDIVSLALDFMQTQHVPSADYPFDFER